MRRVKVKRFKLEHNPRPPHGLNSAKWVEDGHVRGWFHCWATGYEELEGGVGQYAVAIVELEDGTVESPPPDQIQFESPPEE